MKFITLLIPLFMLLGPGLNVANAAPLKRLFQDVKLPTQSVLERQVWATPLASNTSYVAASLTGPTSAAAASATSSSFSSQPDVPRNLEITPGGACSTQLNSCAVDIVGTNYNSHSIHEAFTFSANSCGKQIGTKAFKTITSISWAASCEATPFGVNWNIGTGTKLGLKRCLNAAGDIAWAVAGSTREGTLPTMASNMASVELNTAVFNTAPNGSNNLYLYFVQDFNSSCF